MVAPSHLTPKQKSVLEYLCAFEKEHGHAPSQQEIAHHFRFQSLGTVQNYLVRLEAQGFLTRDWNAKRSLMLTPLGRERISAPAEFAQDDSILRLPLLGRVAAGHPIEAIENQDTFEVPKSFLSSGDHFVLQVRGDSMIEDGIFDRDYVVIRRDHTPQTGQTIVASVGGEVTLKRYYRQGDRIELRPANSHYESIFVIPSSSDFRVLGILVTLIRRMGANP
jgi:repressor LexA